MRIDIEERKRRDAKEATRLQDVEGKLIHSKKRLETQSLIVKNLEARFEEEKQFTQDLNVRLRHERTQIEAVDTHIRELQERKGELMGQIESANDEAVTLRRIKDQNEQERRHLEGEVSALSQVCEVRMKANENLARELQQMAEDDEVIRQRLDRANRISSLKDRCGSQINESLKNLEKSRSPIRRREA